MGPSANYGITGVTFDSAGHQLVGAAYLARGSEPKPTAIILHGCPGIDHNGDLAAGLRDRGWNALIFHYQGCWGSQGSYNLATVAADVRAAVDYLSDSCTHAPRRHGTTPRSRGQITLSAGIAASYANSSSSG